MILVDGVTEYGKDMLKGLRHKRWSHMVSDVSEDELHAMATRLGLKRSWFQTRPKASAAHYDITPPKRELAIRYGAVAVSSRELAARNFDGLRRRGLLPMIVCGTYLGDNDGTCPQLTCVRWKYHVGDCDNVNGDPTPERRPYDDSNRTESS